MSTDLLKGTLIARAQRPGRAVYIARATLASGGFAQALVETHTDIPLGPCEFNVDHAIVRGRAYSASGFVRLGRGKTGFPAPPALIRRLASQAAAPYGVDVSWREEPSGLWVLVARTPRGNIEVPVIPGDKWTHVLAIAGLGGTVPWR